MTRVELIGDHPHAGRRGYLVAGATPETLQGIRVNGVFMALVRFDDNDGGSCYAQRQHIRVIQEPRKERFE